jgi:predicted permease
MFGRLRRVFRILRHRKIWEQNLDAELRSHIEMRAADLRMRGLPDDAALRQARIELGSSERYKEEVRTSAGIHWLDDLRQDSIYALRVLRKSPGFALTAIISVALGVGANTVVFSVLHAALFRPLAVWQPDRLLFVQRGTSSAGVSFPAYRDFSDRSTTIAGAVAYRVDRVGLDAGSGAERIWGYLATGNYFDVVGLTPVLGRFFHADDEKGINSSPYIVLSYDLWRTRFQGALDTPGRTVRINGKPFTVLGVAPSGFRGTEAFIRPDFWIPLAMDPQIEGFNWLEERAAQNAWMIVRARPGVDARAVQADLDRIAGNLAGEFPKTDSLPPIVVARPGLLGNVLRAPVQQFALAIMVIAGLVLLAVCANLAGLLAARGPDRHREIALRVSMGAGRGRIVRQLLTESAMLISLAGAAGCVTAWLLLRVFSAWRPPFEVPVQLDATPDLSVLLFASGVTVLTGILAGALPARQAWRVDSNTAIKASLAPGRLRFRDLQLAMQCALCCLVVACSLVSVRGLLNSLSARPGFNAKGLSVVSFDPALAGYEKRDGQQFQRRAIEAVSQLPGAISAAFANSIPLDGNGSTTTLFPEGSVSRRLGTANDQPSFPANQGVETGNYSVSPNFFRTMGTLLLAGREFEWREPQPVAILNQAAARRLFGTEAAVGRRIQYSNGRLVTVIGVAEDGKYSSFMEDPKPVVFLPIVRTGDVQTTLIVRSSVPEGKMASEMERAVKRLAPAMPLYSVGSLHRSMALALLPAWGSFVAFGAFGLLALMLAVTGVYGLAAYSVARRRREIAIRMAVGARSREVLSAVLGRVAILAGIGIIAGLGLSAAVGRLLSSFVFQASTRDTRTLAAVAILMLAVAVVSALGPVRRAISVDPSMALRQD